MNPTLYFLSYNNYYNRIVKREDSLTDYQEYVIGFLSNVTNWNPNDGVNARQIINWSNEMPDYMLVVDEDGNIDSRWFVIEAARTRAMQLELTLRRDVVADYYDSIVTAPCFIEKATPQSIRDPAIYNSENMRFNQIKTGETLLWDETACPWIVGYIPRDSFETDTTVSINAQLGGSQDITVTNLSDYAYYQYNNQVVNGSVTNPKIQILVTHMAIRGGTLYRYGNAIKINENGTFIGVTRSGFTGSIKGYYYTASSTAGTDSFTDEYARTVVGNMPTLADDFKAELENYLPTGSITEEEYQGIVADNGKIIYESSTGKYYKVNLTSSQNSSSQSYFVIGYESSLGIKMQNAIVKSFGSYTLANPIDTTDVFSFTSETSMQQLSIDPIEVQISVQIPAVRYQASETPYDIFCIPYSNSLTIKENGETYIQNTNKGVGINIAQQIMTKVGSGNVYDVQLLPYCPVRYCIKEDGSFDIGGAIYSDITADGEKVNVLLWATSDNFSLQIPISIQEKQNVLDKKVATSTEFIRLCAPNFSKSFEFDPQMNNGMDYVTVLCHYKPFNPYIKVQPNFKGLYGNNYNDARGLICQGDFSLAQVTSAWADYELQNKNYQNIFDREMQNLKTTQSIQRQQETISGYLGALGGAAGGAMTGAMVGGGVGAGVLGVLGAVGSIAGAHTDRYFNDQLRGEALDYKQDMYGYQIGNIQAIPNGLSKTSAISPDNKFVPFIEYYSCTDEEKEALIGKLTYNGYTIMRIGTIQNFITAAQSYIKGKLIRLEGISDDYHLLNAISGEMDKGVFI